MAFPHSTSLHIKINAFCYILQNTCKVLKMIGYGAMEDHGMV